LAGTVDDEALRDGESLAVLVQLGGRLLQVLLLLAIGLLGLARDRLLQALLHNCLALAKGLGWAVVLREF